MGDGNVEKQQIFTFIDDHREEMLVLWSNLVNQESGSAYKEGIDTIQAKIKGILENEGAAVR
ncbi:MAG: cpg2, partial [Firmicutes bacterium]|nr:cpg2 [Bacillota bacterium]